MLTKNWNEYNQDEKSKLLFHVYVYYGKANDIIDHLDEYRKLISTNPDDVLKIYITAKYLNFAYNIQTEKEDIYGIKKMG